MIKCYCDYEAPEFCLTVIRKARKPRRCEECRGVIAAGEQYEHVSGKWDGCLLTFDTCLRCLDLRTWVTNSVPCFCWAHGNLDDDMKDAVYDARCRAPEETIGLHFGLLRRFVLRRRHNQRARPPA